MKFLLKLQQRIDALSQRERILVLLAGAVVLGVIWILVFLDPVNKRVQTAQVSVARSQAQIDRLGQHLSELEAQLRNDVDAQRRDQLQAIQEQIAAVDGQLKQSLEHLVAPKQMAAILRRLVEDRKPLRLISVHSLAAIPLLEGNQASGNKVTDPEALVFKHVVEVELQGSYLDVLAYVETLDQLNLNFFWDGLDI